MNRHAIYRQINKDCAYWIEKRRVGQKNGGQTAGLLSYIEDGVVCQNILFDCGLGTMEGLADCCDDSFWDDPLVVFITHGHADHHLELMILAEIYCERRGENALDTRPPLHVYCTEATQQHLCNTHRWGYTGGGTLLHQPVLPDSTNFLNPFTLLPLAVDHFPGAVIYAITFGTDPLHKVIVGWDMTTLPLSEAEIRILVCPSLALFEGTTWTKTAIPTGHSCITELVDTSFLDRLELAFDPAAQRYGAYLVHYSGLEDPDGMMSDEALQAKINDTYPHLAPVLHLAERGQSWRFDL